MPRRFHSDYLSGHFVFNNKNVSNFLYAVQHAHILKSENSLMQINFLAYINPEETCSISKREFQNICIFIRK